MTTEYPSISLIESNMPEQYDSWKRALDHAEFTYEELIKRPIRHTDYPYQQLKDVWSLVLERWDSLAVLPASLYMQEEISAGARILKRYAVQRLESLRQYDHSPYRTVWLGTGQPKDPYDSNYPSLI